MKTVKIYLCLVFFVLINNVNCTIDDIPIEDINSLSANKSDPVVYSKALSEDDRDLKENDKVLSQDNIGSIDPIEGNDLPDESTSSDGLIRRIVTVPRNSKNGTNKLNDDTFVKSDLEIKEYVVEICNLCFCNESVYSNKSILQIVCLNVEKELNLKNIIWPKNEKNLEIEVTFQYLRLTIVPMIPENDNIILISFFDNLITSTYSGALSHLNNLASLSFKKNDLQSIVPGMFKGLKKVKELDLSQNRLQDFQPQDFEALVSLKKLFLNENLIRVLPMEALNKLHALEYLDCSHNGLYLLNTSSSQAEFMSRLTELNLSHNKIPAVHSSDFSKGILLKSIDLSNNDLSIIERTSFDNCKNLVELSLASNKIVSLPSFPHSIRTIHLQRNSLLDWPNIPDSVRHLDISYNQLYQMTDNIAQMFENVESLNVSGNILSEFNIKSPLTNLKMLDFSFNRLEVVPGDFNKIILPLLNDLYIDGNPLKQLTFTEEIVLRKLSAKSLPEIESLDETSFKNVGGRSQTFRNNSEDIYCVEIAVSQCKKLTTISEKTFQNVSLCHLDISDNKLQEISKDVADWTKIPKGVNLQGNPWNCNCQLQWLLDELLETLVIENPSLLHELRCYTPKHVKGMRLVHWYKWQKKAFCSGNLLFGRSSSYTQMGSVGNIHDDMEDFWTTKTIILLVCIAILGTIVVGLTIYLVKGKRRYDRKIRLLTKKKRQSMSDAEKMNKNGGAHQNNALLTS